MVIKFRLKRYKAPQTLWFWSVLAFLLNFFSAMPAKAAIVECGNFRDASGTPIPCNFCDLFVTGKNIVNFLWWDVAFPLAILLLVVAAFFFLISGGNPNLHTRAKSIATAAIMGLLITFGSWLVIGTIINFFANSSVQPWPWNKPDCVLSAAPPSCSSFGGVCVPSGQCQSGYGIAIPSGGFGDCNTTTNVCCQAGYVIPPSSPVCGNAIVETGEQCDRGNASNGSCPSSCSTSCTLNTCYACSGSSCVVTSGGQFGDSGCNNTCSQTLAVSCSGSPASINIGQSATWTASPSGGAGSYTYSWSGTDGLSGSSSTVSKTYTTAGTKSASVTVTSGTQTLTRSCTNTVNVDYPPISGSCAPSPPTINISGSTTWSATPSGGTGTYTYTWSGTDGLSGNTQSINKSYTTGGTKSAQVTITSGSQTATITCSTLRVVSPPPSLTASCSVSPTSILVGETATWSSVSSGGTGSYTYFWSGTDGLTSSSQSATKTYTTAGTKSASVTVTSGSQTVTVSCSSTLAVNLPPLNVSCSVAPNPVNTSQPAIWAANATGGTGTYTYSWSGTDGLSGTTQSVSKTYATAGSKTATVLVTSGSLTQSVSCGPLQVNLFNNAPIAAAQVSKDGLNYSNSISVTTGVPTNIWFSASGSSDPDGWTSVGGVSNGGKCQWNSDLNQGAPTFETTINNPASSSACNISLGSLTFNDAPGTYTYQVLQITDNTGAISNIATVQVFVLCGSGQFFGEYFNDQVYSGDGSSASHFVGTPAQTQCESIINHNWFTNSPFSGIVNSDYFSVRWTGNFIFNAGTYRFFASSDDGVRIFVDGNQIINGWLDQAFGNYSFDTTLSAGTHEVKVAYYEHTVNAHITVNWAQR
ncbi:MAG: hypothetical protein A2828_00845 [Candidatus Terrybacteria bacterium RIFCSPHIGHO2_01_FULL_43_35]|uniref:PA14 domain-containing protein n=1 Tax=Candidatus Terrybacteria bacterium RIFCSPHIGHO2_01_FULL_43_35 TaxID=1802361 RepID=A0A1G2PC92_9BACT|nr:MAG: hypothetical protein A2828_00845 [Candidatus Terrybacteria bacterium RIFCSPHIGHO2_01_FULL_43_35]